MCCGTFTNLDEAQLFASAQQRFRRVFFSGTSTELRMTSFLQAETLQTQKLDSLTYSRITRFQSGFPLGQEGSKTCHMATERRNTMNDSVYTTSMWTRRLLLHNTFCSTFGVQVMEWEKDKAFRASRADLGIYSKAGMRD